MEPKAEILQRLGFAIAGGRKMLDNIERKYLKAVPGADGLRYVIASWAPRWSLHPSMRTLPHL